MSRGPGALQRRVLETLAAYQRLGSDLQWQWPSGRRYALGNYASASDIRAYERGQRIPVWMLLRDIGCSCADLSRALRSLEQQQMAFRYGGDLEHVGWQDRACKFASITAEGEAWLKRQETQSAKAGAYPSIGAEA